MKKTVRCGMCPFTCELDDWNEEEIFICKECAKIMEEIRVHEVQNKYTLSGDMRLKMFDLLKEAKKK